MTTNSKNDNLLWRHLKTIPAFRGLLRAVEARFYHQLNLKQPILDLGCGDGHFAQMAFDHTLDVGIDPWWGPLQQSQKSQSYHHLIQSMGDTMPFPNHHFATIISNSVLEHIPDIQAVLNEASRVLKPGGKLVITMPSHHFTANLGGATFLEKIGFDGMGQRYRHFFNFISRHEHTDSAAVWAQRLAQAGFEVDRWQYYFSPQALHTLEKGHIQGLPSALMRFLTGHWIIAPWPSSLKHTYEWVRPYYEEEAAANGAYLFIVANKAADEPITAPLPEAKPFHVAHMLAQEAASLAPAPATATTATVVAETAVTPPSPPISPSPIPKSKTSLPALGPSLVTTLLLGMTFLTALRGQALLRANWFEPSSGLRWLLFSTISLLLLLWQQQKISFTLPNLPSFRLPSVTNISSHHWFYPLALIPIYMAQRLTRAGTVDPPTTIALLLWLGGIGAAFYALSHKQTATESPARATRNLLWAFLVPIVLFVVAYILRIVDLAGHPFILNGTEANIGLDALRVANGSWHNPFGTGWLTNPTLPLYFLAIPLRLFGPSTFAIRALSPIIGSLTVITTYWLGDRLWGREVGLIAAVLLAGSHFHIHYSRLGLTNIWDPLLILLALGLLAIAWQDEGNQRRNWLLAGLAIGFNAYFYTSSHLLPLMLVILLAWAVLFERQSLWQKRAHILAMVALAFAISLPQLIYYNSNPTIFMERANALGILDQHSGWLTAEAQRLNTTPRTIWWQQFWQAALAFNASWDVSSTYKPQAPLLSFGPALLFLFGLLISFFQSRRLNYALLFIWVSVTILFAGALLQNPPHSHRLIVVAPALTLLAAIALIEFGRFILTATQTTEDTIATTSLILPITLLLAIIMVVADVRFYFGPYANMHTYGDRNTEIADNMGHYLNELDNNWTAYFYGPPNMYVDFPTIPFLAQTFSNGRNLYDVLEPNITLPPATTTNQTHIFLPERFAELEAIQTEQPNGRLRTFSGFHATPLFYAYEVAP